MYGNSCASISMHLNVLHSKLSLDSSGKKSSMCSAFVVAVCWICETNFLVILSESCKNCRIWFGELRPFWSSERSRHHSLPFLCNEEKKTNNKIELAIHHLIVSFLLVFITQLFFVISAMRMSIFNHVSVSASKYLRIG